MCYRVSGLLALVAVAAVSATSANETVGGGECDVEVAAGPQFGQAPVLSAPLAAAFMPSVATHADQVLIAWQETDRKANYVAYAIASDGCLGEVRYVEDPLPNPRRPAVAATATGWVLAYEAKDAPDPVIRSIRLDREGGIASGPRTISAPGAVASRVRVASNGDDVVFAWTDVLGHHLARTGPIEELPPTPVGALLRAGGLVNFPRIAIDDEGTIFLAYRDGGPERTDYEIRLVTRRVGEPFSAPINVSRSRGQMSDDVAVVAESDGRVRVAWVEQDAEHPEAFEVVHATIDSRHELSEWKRFGALGLASFKPTLVGGPTVVWQAGTARAGRLYLADGQSAPVHILTEVIGGQAALASDEVGGLHLAFVDTESPPRVRYTRRSNQ